MFDPYEFYCNWQREHGRPAPTREWWDAACAKWARNEQGEAARDQREREQELRDGWGLDGTLGEGGL